MRCNSWLHHVIGPTGLMALLFFISSPAVAEDIGYRTKINLGYYQIFAAESTISVSERSAGLGIALNPEDTFRTSLEQDVFRVDARYRFTKVHAINLTWYKISNRGSNAIQDDISWVDPDGNPIELSAGTQVDAELNYDILKFNYLWSFYRNDKVELTSSLGIHMSDFRAVINAVSQIGNSSSEDPADLESSVPLPNVGIGLEYRVTPKLSWFMRADLFAMQYDDWEGSFSDINLGIEYKIMEHFNLGMGLGSTNLRITEENKEYKFRFDNRLTGLNLYLSTEF